MKPIHIFLSVTAFIVIFCGIKSMGPAPDLTIIKAFGYKWGFNYSNNLGLKLLSLFLIVLGAILIYEHKETNTKESNSL